MELQQLGLSNLKGDRKFRKALYTFVQKQNSPHTKKAYLSTLEQFYKAIPLLRYQDCEQTHIVYYLDWLKIQEYSTASIAQKITVIRSWHQWLNQIGITKFDPSKFIKAPRQDALFGKTEELTDHEVKQLLNTPDISTKQGLRDKVILSIFFFTGMRLDSLRKLRVCDLSYEQGYHIITFKMKGNRLHRVPLIKGSIIHDLKKHIELNGLMNKDFLFRPYKSRLGVLDKPLSDTYIQAMFKKYSKIAQIKTRVTPHSARATVIGHCASRGASEQEIMNLTGHRCSASIRRYNRRKDQIENSAAHKIIY